MYLLAFSILPYLCLLNSNRLEELSSDYNTTWTLRETSSPSSPQSRPPPSSGASTAPALLSQRHCHWSAVALECYRKLSLKRHASWTRPLRSCRVASATETVAPTRHSRAPRLVDLALHRGWAGSSGAPAIMTQPRGGLLHHNLWVCHNAEGFHVKFY